LSCEREDSPPRLPPEVAALDAGARRVDTACGSGRMVWRVWGEGPPLALLHGGYGSWMHWVRTIPAFMDKRTLYVPDLPGLGESDEVPEPTSPDAIARVVSDGLHDLGVDRQALDLVGFSFGGIIAGCIATFAPLRSLTLVGPGALGLPRGETDLLRETPDMTPQERWAIHRTNLGILMLADPDSIDDAAIAMQAANVARARVKSRRFAATTALAEALATAQPKALHWIWGERDAVVGSHMASREAYARANRPDATFTVIPGAGHWVPYEAPNAFNAALGRVVG